MIGLRHIFRFKSARYKDHHLSKLERKIGYRFHQRSLLERAVKHRSVFNGKKGNYNESNEQLEFLGDAVLSLVVAQYLLDLNPQFGEGELTKLKSLVVSGEVLSRCAMELDLGKFLQMGTGEIRSGGRTRPSILEDAYEALVGAVFLDGGLKSTRNFVRRTLLDHIEEIVESSDLQNYKSRLLEYAQANFSTQPYYRVMAETGPDHHKTYKIEVFIRNQSFGYGEGCSKKRAEQSAARQALTKLNIDT
jgi:ribonuclease-3